MPLDDADIPLRAAELCAEGRFLEASVTQPSEHGPVPPVACRPFASGWPRPQPASQAQRQASNAKENAGRVDFGQPRSTRG